MHFNKYMSPWVNRYCGNASGNKENWLNINVFFAIGPSWMHSIEFSNNNTHYKFNNNFHILGLKITKSTLLNQAWWRLPNNTNNAPKFQYSFQSWFFKNFQWKNGSIINRFHTIAPNVLNQVSAPLVIEFFLMISSIT
jgi:hypothetical protein